MDISPEEWRRLAQAIRAACISAAQNGYEQAAISGLCGDGAFEAAIGAIRAVDLNEIVGTINVHAPR